MKCDTLLQLIAEQGITIYNTAIYQNNKEKKIGDILKNILQQT